MAWVKEASKDAEVVLSVCNGAFFLAKAGLLDGLEATTFAGLIEELRTAAPKARIVDDKRWVDNGKIITTAGLSSGIDGSLGRVQWRRFASGLYEPLNLQIVNDTIPVLDRPGSVRLLDVNGDGEADRSETFSNLVILSGESGYEVLDAVRQNGRVAVNFTLPETYKSISLLGRDAVVSLGGGVYRELVRDRCEKFTRQLVAHGIPRTYTEAWYLRPDEDLMAIRFTPFSARNQTPGPDAGGALALKP